jgi:hypothetical protein
MREHFQQGPMTMDFSDDDRDRWSQDGEAISSIVQEVLGQYFEFEDEIVRAVIDADPWHPRDGNGPFWDDTSLYVQKSANTGRLWHRWHHAQEELLHGRRYFSPAAQVLFRDLFEEVDTIKEWTGKRFRPVAYRIPAGRVLYRARVCNSKRDLAEFHGNPLQHVGPPPKDHARAGRMNADGVPVFYGSINKDTCIAEMRPALTGQIAVIAVRTSRPMRVLDFTRLERARSDQVKSYFQADFADAVAKGEFLRRLHTLISRPIVPGKEAEYMITQTMAEYLAFVHSRRFDGVIFASAQRSNGRNVVFFASDELLGSDAGESFGIEYVPDSFKLFSTQKITYTHGEVPLYTSTDNQVFIADDFQEAEWPQ